LISPVPASWGEPWPDTAALPEAEALAEGEGPAGADAAAELEPGGALLAAVEVEESPAADPQAATARDITPHAIRARTTA
jgi:hypothetical protein